MTDWSKYAASNSYDVLAGHNRAYQELLEVVETLFMGLRLPDGSCVVELGGGTGNFTLRLAARAPLVRFKLLDLSPKMLEYAEAKRADQGLENVTVTSADMTAPPLDKESIDLALFVHSLYTLPMTGGNPTGARKSLEAVYCALRPGGHLLICDIGRPIPVNALAKTLFQENVARVGLFRTVSLYASHLQALFQNRRIEQAQRRGEYWTHDLPALAGLVESVGFRVIQSRSDLYFGLDDLVLARRPLASEAP